ANGEFIGRTTRADLRNIAQERIQNKIDPLMSDVANMKALFEHDRLDDADAIVTKSINPAGKAVSAAGIELYEGDFGQLNKRGTAAVSVVEPARNLNIVVMIFALGVAAWLVWVVRQINQALKSTVNE